MLNRPRGKPFRTNPFSLFRAELPTSSRVVDINPHGSSFWTHTAKLTTNLPGGPEQAYFLKVALGEHGMRMMNGEFKSMTALYAALPGFLPQPYARRSYRGMHFLCEFRLVS